MCLTHGNKKLHTEIDRKLSVRRGRERKESNQKEEKPCLSLFNCSDHVTSNDGMLYE
jgi:hypothetical protein